jgi:hypothetical protein
MSADRGVPRARQLARIGARLIGRLPLAAARVEELPVRKEAKSAEYVVYVGWALMGYDKGEPPEGAIRVADLLAGDPAPSAGGD